MSSNENNMINPGNYEEYFILYMDNELSAAEKRMVEDFIAQHPSLAEELDMLMSTKLPLDEVSFIGKEELLSSSMKVATVDEALLLYIDNELPVADRKTVEEKIATDKDYSQQHTMLMQTKLDAAEKIIHPNKKELYRRSERVVAFKTWMRIAAAVVILLFGSLFFLLNNDEQVPPTIDTAHNIPKQKTAPIIKEDVEAPGENTIPQSTQQKQDIASANKEGQKTTNPIAAPAMKEIKVAADPVAQDANMIAQNSIERKREVVQFNVKQFTQPDIDIDAVKETLAHNPVTSNHPVRTTDEDTQLEPADPSGDFKNTKSSSAKGLFRKVTRFIGRNTGIGTADIGDEVLIGAVALKLK